MEIQKSDYLNTNIKYFKRLFDLYGNKNAYFATITDTNNSNPVEFQTL